MGISVSDYLISRLADLGVEEFFGLPGDYNFNIISSVENNKKTNWIGCTNELNAGYAADGYARIKGYGALITTYGVGELSAMNAIAGSMSEFVPVVKITGVPETKYINQNTLIHHNLNTPDYQAFIKAYSNVVETAAFLNENNAKEEIDRVLNVLINTKKPVYIAIPVDICNKIIDDTYSVEVQKSDENNLNKAVNSALELIENSQNPVILADVMVKRFCAKEQLYEFVRKTNYPVTTFLMSKDLINDEEFANYLGTYTGKNGNLNAYRTVNNSSCPIFIGAVISDINTHGFDLKFNPDDFINIQSDFTVVKNKMYKNVLMKDILEILAKKVTNKFTGQCDYDYFYTKVEPSENKINSEYFYYKLQEFLHEGDNLVLETGLINLAGAKLKIKKNLSITNHILWGSIGWATGAALGVDLADKNARTILVTGEGSHQLSAQEISTMMRNNLKPVIFVINNGGYTIERLLSKDPMDKFNDIAGWNYSKLPYVFGENVYSISVSNDIELDEAFKTIEKEQQNKMCYIEMHFDMFELPELAKESMNNLKLSKL